MLLSASMTYNALLTIIIVLICIICLSFFATLFLFTLNRRFINRGIIKLNGSYRAEVKRIEGRIVCYQLFENNKMIDYIEGISSKIFKFYVTGIENCYVFNRYSKKIECFSKESIPQAIAGKFINLN